MSDVTTVIEVGEANFASEVLERSKQVPVVVDFWAAWCGPCRTLGPVLEELAREDAGRWVLAKVDVDANPQLAQVFGIQGIPAVKAFVDGQPVDEFTGALPKNAVRQFLDRLVPSPGDDLPGRAEAAERAGDHEAAEALWGEALALNADDDTARLRRAQARAARGARREAREDLALVPEDSLLREEADQLAMVLGWADRVDERGGLDAVRARAGDAPEGAAARYDLGCALAVAGDFEGALAEFLEVVRLDRAFEDDAGRRGMVAVFGILGESPVTVEWRGRLSALLF